MPLWGKRKAGIKGPFSKTQVEGFIESGRLPDGTLVSETPDGPWQPLTISSPNANNDSDVDSQYEYDLQQSVGEDDVAIQKRELWSHLSDRMESNASAEALRIIDELETFHLSPEESGDLATLRRSLMGVPESDHDYVDDNSNSNERQMRRSKITARQSGPLDTSAESPWMWLLNPKQFLTGPIYQYSNQQFPSLAAAIRYYALIAKIGYYIARVMWYVSVVIGVLSVLGLFLREQGELSFFLYVGSLVGYICLVFFVLALSLIVLNLYLMLSLATCELVAVLLKIEKNTRTVSDQ